MGRVTLSGTGGMNGTITGRVWVEKDKKEVKNKSYFVVIDFRIWNG